MRTDCRTQPAPALRTGILRGLRQEIAVVTRSAFPGQLKPSLRLAGCQFTRHEEQKQVSATSDEIMGNSVRQEHGGGLLGLGSGNGVAKLTTPEFCPSKVCNFFWRVGSKGVDSF